MGHFAKVIDGRVDQVIVADPDFFDTYVDYLPGQWIETSYNTRGNVHYRPDSDQPSGQPPLRGNFADKGYVYDKENDVFYAPQPFPSWVLNKHKWMWEPPIAMPNNGGVYYWDEPTTSWVRAR